MRRHTIRLLLALATSLAFAGPAQALGGNYDIVGGTAADQAQVRGALAASSFDWGVVPGRVTIRIAAGVDSHALPGTIWLDRDLLAAGIFSWAVVQDEYAHQVDLLLFDEGTRARLNAQLGGKAWCHGSRPGLRHGDYGCERFASTLVWSFWPSRHNAYRPKAPGDEAGAMSPPRFRALVQSLVSQRLAAFQAR